MASDIEHMPLPQVAAPQGFRPLISGLIKKLRLYFLALLIKAAKKLRLSQAQVKTTFLKNKNRRQKIVNLVMRLPDM